MKVRILISLILFGFTFPLRAETVKLNCESDQVSNNNQFQLIIDVDNRSITLGANVYEITNINDENIFVIETGVRTGNNGEAFSLNRNSGRFKWASIDAGTETKSLNHTDVFSVETKTGQCKRPVI